MKIFLSPAKTLDFENAPAVSKPTAPLFSSKAALINKELRKYSSRQLQKLQNISSQLAELNVERNAKWEPRPTSGTRAALYVFQGDVYQGMQAAEWSPEDVAFAERHLRILSGLYGILRPNDQILPYRLEMGTQLPVNGTANLHQFWKDILQEHVEKKWDKNELMVNLASKEYFRAISQLNLAQPVLNFTFKDYSKGQYKVIPYYAKIARGLMARYIVQNRLETREEFQSFSTNGYYFSNQQSTTDELVFLRDENDK